MWMREVEVSNIIILYSNLLSIIAVYCCHPQVGGSGQGNGGRGRGKGRGRGGRRHWKGSGGGVG